MTDLFLAEKWLGTGKRKCRENVYCIFYSEKKISYERVRFTGSNMIEMQFSLATRNVIFLSLIRFQCKGYFDLFCFKYTI